MVVIILKKIKCHCQKARKKEIPFIGPRWVSGGTLHLFSNINTTTCSILGLVVPWEAMVHAILSLCASRVWYLYWEMDWGHSVVVGCTIWFLHLGLWSRNWLVVVLVGKLPRGLRERITTTLSIVRVLPLVERNDACRRGRKDGQDSEGVPFFFAPMQTCGHARQVENCDEIPWKPQFNWLISKPTFDDRKYFGTCVWSKARVFYVQAQPSRRQFDWPVRQLSNQFYWKIRVHLWFVNFTDPEISLAISNADFMRRLNDLANEMQKK